METPIRAELVVDARASLGEGPVWDDRANLLYWVDIEGRALHVSDPSGGADRRVKLAGRTGFVALRAGGGLIAGGESGLFELDPDSGRATPLVDPEADLPDNRFNDGKCDPVGRLWAGTMSMKPQPGAGSLYRLDPGGACTRMLQGVSVSNGLGWSLDAKVMYYIDSRAGEVSAFDFDARGGDISNRRTLIPFGDQPGSPDGMCVDAEGMIWVAHFRGGCVSRWNPASGERLALLEVPAPRTTSCTFGGAALDELYVTTARAGLHEAELKQFPHSGGLFRLKPGPKGLPPTRFAATTFPQ